MKAQPEPSNMPHEVPPSVVVGRYVEALPARYFENVRYALDVGCGLGRNALYLATHGFEVTGVDISEEYLQEADQRRRAMGLGIQACHFVEADISSLPDFARSFDVVAVNEVLNNFQKGDQYEIIRELQQRSKNQGVHLISGYLATPDVKDRNNQDKMLKPGELKRFYQSHGWHIRSYIEDEPKTRRFGDRELVETKAQLIAVAPRNNLRS